MEHFHYYLYGRDFILRADHKALEAFNTKSYLVSDRNTRWLGRVENYSFKVQYIEGENIPHVDALNGQCTEEKDRPINQISLEDEKQVILNTYEDLAHRGAKAVHERLKER